MEQTFGSAGVAAQPPVRRSAGASPNPVQGTGESGPHGEKPAPPVVTTAMAEEPARPKTPESSQPAQKPQVQAAIAAYAAPIIQGASQSRPAPSPRRTPPDNKTVAALLTNAPVEDKLGVLREVSHQALQNIKNAKSNDEIIGNLAQVNQLGTLLGLNPGDPKTQEALKPVLSALGDPALQKRMAQEQFKLAQQVQGYLHHILTASPGATGVGELTGHVGKMRERWNNFVGRISNPYFNKVNVKAAFAEKPQAFMENYNFIQRELGYMIRDLEKFAQGTNQNRATLKSITLAAASMPLIPLGPGAFILGGAGVTGLISAGSGSSKKEVAADVGAHLVGSLTSMGLLKASSPALSRILGDRLGHVTAGATSEAVGNILDNQTQVGIKEGRLLTRDEAALSGGVGLLTGGLGNLKGRGKAPDGAAPGTPKKPAPGVSGELNNVGKGPASQFMHMPALTADQARQEIQRIAREFGLDPGKVDIRFGPEGTVPTAGIDKASGRPYVSLPENPQMTALYEEAGHLKTIKEAMDGDPAALARLQEASDAAKELFVTQQTEKFMQQLGRSTPEDSVNQVKKAFDHYASTAEEVRGSEYATRRYLDHLHKEAGAAESSGNIGQAWLYNKEIELWETYHRKLLDTMKAQNIPHI